jgi:hydrogenase expression/formation protein HypE
MSTRTLSPERVAMKHGAGGRAMRALIEQVFLDGADRADTADRIGLGALDDGAAFRVGDDWIVITTDSHVIQPRFFPGGDIGRLAIAGTVNDLAMMGVTTPLGLTCAVIIEEGFPREELERIQQSMVITCREAGAPVVTGDTKVMGHGEIDGLVINTTGLGMTRRLVRDAGLQVGDAVIVTGTIGDHGMAVMATRHALALEGDLQSDVAPLNGLVAAALAAGGSAIHAMKDPTRGGIASALHEMAAKAGVSVILHELELPIRDGVRAAAELLGIEPLHVANEGKALLGVAADAADRVLLALRHHPLGRDAAIIGAVRAEHAGTLILDTGFGHRLLAESEGEPLPRIC